MRRLPYFLSCAKAVRNKPIRTMPEIDSTEIRILDVFVIGTISPIVEQFEILGQRLSVDIS
jgi:hypothetical protein